MVVPVAIKFQIIGPGSADLEFKIGDKTFVASGVSYTCDVLGDLLRSAIMVAVGADRARASFDREPVEWRLQLLSTMDIATGFGRVQVYVFEFDDFYAD